MTAVVVTPDNTRTETVLTIREGALGRIVLNRPQALNALTLPMVLAVLAHLAAFEDDPAVEAVTIEGAGERGLCAGGDIRTMYESALAGERYSEEFLRAEYTMNARIARYPKPVVALMDGLVMGGGVGISAHAGHRIVSDRSVVAMPEVGIGYTPDVGGTWLLTRGPGELGTHVALTGSRLGPDDAIAAGLADQVVPLAARDALLNAFRRSARRGAGVLRTYDARIRLPESPLEAARPWIDTCYAADDVETIVARLQARPEQAAQAAAADILTKSPTSLKVTLRMLRTARRLPSLDACLDLEYRACCTFAHSPDFIEGVRAAVIDKDQKPAWSLARLEDVAEGDLDRFFASRGDDELGLAGPEPAADAEDRMNEHVVRRGGRATPCAASMRRHRRLAVERPGLPRRRRRRPPEGGPMSRIAFLGLGNMGRPMATNLVTAGHTVWGFDPVAAARVAAEAAGVTVGPDLKAVVDGAATVVTMLPDGPSVLDCYRQGVLPAAGPDTLLVDCSTIDVATARTVHAAAAAAGLAAVDAPVSGGVMGAQAATLTFMAGGSDAAVERARPILETMGKKVVHCGAPGAGQAAKICNNLILGISMMAVSEGFVLAESLGLSHQALFDVASASSGQCWALTTNCPVPGPVPASPANRDYQPGFAARLMAKDLGLADAAARLGGVELPFGSQAAAAFARFATEGGADRDFSAIIETIRAASAGTGGAR